MKRNIILYGEYFKLGLARISHNKLESIIGAIAWFVLQICGLISAFAIIQESCPINGWEFYEIGLLYAGMTFARAISMLFFDAFWQMKFFIQSGEFDHFLTKPISPFFQLITYQIQLAGIGNLLFSILTFIYCFINLNFTASISGWLLFVLYLICGTFILSAMFFMLNCIYFWIMGDVGVGQVMLSFVEFIKFPINILPKFFQILLTWIIPLAFVNFFPIGFFLGKFDSKIMGILPFIVCFLLWKLAFFIWKKGLAKYDSTGS